MNGSLRLPSWPLASPLKTPGTVKVGGRRTYPKRALLQQAIFLPTPDHALQGDDTAKSARGQKSSRFRTLQSADKATGDIDETPLPSFKDIQAYFSRAAPLPPNPGPSITSTKKHVPSPKKKRTPMMSTNECAQHQLAADPLCQPLPKDAPPKAKMDTVTLCTKPSETTEPAPCTYTPSSGYLLPTTDSGKEVYWAFFFPDLASKPPHSAPAASADMHPVGSRMAYSRRS